MARTAGSPPEAYRPAIADRFGLTVGQLAAIEREGDANEWAPKRLRRPAE